MAEDKKVLVSKLTTLYVIADKFSLQLNKEHTVKFVSLVADTDLGLILLQFGEKLKKSVDMQFGFVLLSKGDVKDTIFLRVYVESVEKLNEVFGTITQVGKFLSTMNIKIEFETFENAGKVHFEPF